MPEIEYVWDELSDNVIEEYEDGVLSASYTHEPGLWGNLLSQNRNGVTSYYHYDGRGDTVALTDDSGNVTDTKEYDAWGNVIASMGSTTTAYWFVGRKGYQFDVVNQRHYVRSRWYMNSVAQWLSHDPLPFLGDMNLFRYSKNNPLTNADPSGKITVSSVDSYLPNECDKKGAYIAWVFQLNKKAPCDGFIVQQVDVRCELSACISCPVTSPLTPSFSYWEAWEVKFDDDVEVDFDRNNFTDKASIDIPFEGSCGNYTQIGTIKFFCKTPTGDLNTLWKKFQVHGEPPCGIDAGKAPSLGPAEGPPKWWEKPPIETGARSFGAYWKCCQCKDRFVTSNGTPVY